MTGHPGPPPETPWQTIATQVLRLHCVTPPPQVKTPPHCVCPPPQVIRKQVAPQVWMPWHWVGPPQVIKKQV